MLALLILADAREELFTYLSEAVGFLTLIVGVALVGSTIFAGIQYTSSGGDSGKTKKAKTRLASNVVVLILYIMSAAVLNFILPG